MSILKWVTLLSSLTESEKNNLSLFCQEKHLNVGEVLFKENDEATAMYILKTWSIEISKIIEWRKTILWEVHAEEILGEMALFSSNHKRMATAIWLTPCELIVILSFSIKELTSKHPALWEKIKNIIDDRVENNEKYK